MPFCTQCGKQNPDDANFCSQCGRRLADDTAAGSEQAAGRADERESATESTATMSPTGAPGAGEQAGEGPLSDGDAAAVDALPAGSALLVVQRGPSAGSRFLLDTDVVSAGRHPESEIFLDDVTVSRRHAEFRREPGGFRVVDVGSLNGTYVNRDRIDDVPLQGGDEVQVGKFRLVYFTSPAAEQAS